MSASRSATVALRRMARPSIVSSLMRSTPSSSSSSYLRPSLSSSSTILSSSSSSHRSFFSSSKSTQEQQTPSQSSSSTASSTSSSSADASTASSSTPPNSTTPSSSTSSSSSPPPPPPPPPSSSDAALAEKTAALTALEAKYKDTYDRLLRTAAEMENVRRTSRLDVDNARKYASTGFAKSMLEVADTLELAAKSAKEQLGEGEGGAVVKSLLEGIEMTEKVLAKALGDHGVQKVEAMGAKFNPHEHHGLFEVEDEGKEAGTVAHVMKAGYKINDRILRAAQVGTVKAKK